MTDEKALDLVQNLHRHTLAGKIDWGKGPTGRSFRATFGDFLLDIDMIPDSDYPDEPDYALAIRGSDGREIETISNITLRPLIDRVTPDGLNPYVVLQQTYKAARRRALGFDKALDSILDQLKKA